MSDKPDHHVLLEDIEVSWRRYLKAVFGFGEAVNDDTLLSDKLAFFNGFLAGCVFVHENCVGGTSEEYKLWAERQRLAIRLLQGRLIVQIQARNGFIKA